ncbi:MAG: hypothetical protein RIS47_751 [Bacteroidota bacterium]|jgi:polyhydroxyalkanoate synthesis regulator phasin
MDNLFKNLLYTGVGVVAQAKEKLEKTIQSLVEEEKISTQEGKKIVDDFLNGSGTKKDDIEKELKSTIERLIKAFSFATTSELNSLKERIEALEALLAGMDANNAAPKAIGEQAIVEDATVEKKNLPENEA